MSDINEDFEYTLTRRALRQIKAEAWDEGYRARIDFMALRNEVRAEDNPYRSGADR